MEYEAYDSESDKNSEYGNDQNDSHDLVSTTRSEPLVNSVEIDESRTEVGLPDQSQSSPLREMEPRKYSLTPTSASTDHAVRLRHGSVMSLDTKVSPAITIKSHSQKDSQGSHYSELSTVSSAEDQEAKDKKKKSMFGSLFKKRSKKEKHSNIDSVDTGERLYGNMGTSATINPTATHRPDSALELPTAVKEMRSSVLMDIDPVAADMIEEPSHRGPVDEVEMKQVQRQALSPAQLTDESPAKHLVWTDTAIDSYLFSGTAIHQNLILTIQQQAKIEIMKHKKYATETTLPVYTQVNDMINAMKKVCRRLYAMHTIFQS